MRLQQHKTKSTTKHSKTTQPCPRLPRPYACKRITAAVGNPKGPLAAGAGGNNRLSLATAGGCWRPLEAGGKRWQLQTTAGGRLQPLAAAGRRWQPLGAAGGYWRLLAAVCGWRPLTAAGDCWWLLVTGAGRCWLVLDDVIVKLAADAAPPQPCLCSVLVRWCRVFLVVGYCWWVMDCGVCC